MKTKILSNRGTMHSTHREQEVDATTVFGFWIYLMSDCILFATLFATYGVLRNGVAGGPSGKDIFELLFVLVETFYLLFSSITYGMAILAMERGAKNWVNTWLGVTFFFGLAFICMELYEFYHLVMKGFGPACSAFLSAFFALVGTHGVHVLSGLIWILVMIVKVFDQGLTSANQTSLQCLSLFWHFLDLIWICVFTVVYLVGVL